MKFKSDIEVQAGLKDSSGSNGTSGQILSSNGTTVSWVPAGSSVANDVQNQVKAGVAINKGQAVYVTSADGTNIIVGLASNTTEATSSKTLGLLDATVAINGFANVVQIGRLEGLNTSTAIVGDPVWLGTNGNLIYGLANKPYAPAHLVYIGVVTRVNANNGEIFINVQNGFELKEIHDVDIVSTAPVGNDILAFEGAPVNLWKNKTIPAVLGYTPVTDARTLTINGVTQDLSANRTWTVSGGIGGSGTINRIPKFTASTTIGDSLISEGSGVINIDGSLLAKNTSNYNGVIVDNSSSATVGGGYFSVKSFGVGRGLFAVAGAISGSADNNVGIFAEAGSGMGAIKYYVNGSGTASHVMHSNGNVTIGTATDAGYKLDVNGTGRFTGVLRVDVIPPATTGGSVNIRDNNASGTNTSFAGVFFNSGPGSDYSIGKLSENANGFFQIRNGNTGSELLRISNIGATTLTSLAGSGSRMVIADANGLLSTQTVPTGTVTSVSGAGGYGGLTLTGTVTTTGSLTLGGTPTGTWPISISGNATYSTNATRLYASDAPYRYGDGTPYYMAMTYNSGVNRWRLAVTPATPAAVEVAYSDASGNADTVDGYHAASLWRSDGGVWNPGANITLGQTSNGQEWSFDITRNGYTGGYWHVWDSTLSTMLKVDPNNGKVYAPYNFVGNLEGSVTTAANLSGSINSASSGISSMKINDTRYWVLDPNAPGSYFQAITLGNGSDFTQIGVNSSQQMYFRFNGSSNVWFNVLSSNNYNSYAPTLTGTGASGTWGINVTGNSETVTHNQNRTDGSSYAVLWGNNSGTTAAYSCAAVTIQSNVGMLSASRLYAAQYIFPSTTFNPSAAPRSTTEPMSIKMWNNYFNGIGLGSDYGTVLEYNGMSGHVDSQVYFDAAGGSWYRSASYNSGWQGWQRYVTEGSTWNISITGNAANSTYAEYIRSYTGRTDSSSYPVVWNNGSTYSPNYVCDSVRITSSNATLDAKAFIATPALNQTGLIVNHGTGTGAPAAKFNSAGGGTTYGANTVTIDTCNYGAGLKIVTNLWGYSQQAVQFTSNTTTVGSITCSTTSTTYGTSSDYRLKENIVSIDSPINRLKDLNPCRFNFISEPEKTVDGFIAHEVQEIIPEAVVGEKNELDYDGSPKYQAIDQSKIVPLLTAALQEAISKIEELENRLSILENK